MEARYHALWFAKSGYPRLSPDIPINRGKPPKTDLYRDVDITEAFCEFLVLGIIHRHRNDRGFVLGKGFFKGRCDLPRSVEHFAPDTKGLGKKLKIRIIEFKIGMLAVKMVLLLPLDQTILTIEPHHIDGVETKPGGGFQILHIHQKPGITADRHDLAIRESHLGTKGSRHRKTHSAEPVRDQAGIGFLTLLVARDPHLMGADIR